VEAELLPEEAAEMEPHDGDGEPERLLPLEQEYLELRKAECYSQIQPKTGPDHSAR